MSQHYIAQIYLLSLREISVWSQPASQHHRIGESLLFPNVQTPQPKYSVNEIWDWHDPRPFGGSAAPAQPDPYLDDVNDVLDRNTGSEPWSYGPNVNRECEPVRISQIIGQKCSGRGRPAKDWVSIIDRMVEERETATRNGLPWSTAKFCQCHGIDDRGLRRALAQRRKKGSRESNLTRKN